MNRILECPGCKKTNTDPKLLTCGHCLCVKCITDVIGKRGSGNVQCRQCEQPTCVEEGGVKTLSEDTRMVYMRKYFIHWKSNSLCSKKDGAQAVHFCSECNIDLCSDCAHRHTQHRLFNGHTLLELRKVQCSQHERYFEYFCPDCPRLLCAGCVGEACSDHGEPERVCDITYTNQADMDDVINTIYDRIKHHNTEYRPKMERVEQLIRNAEQQEVNIIEHVEKLSQKIQERKQHLIGQVRCTKEQLVEIKKKLDDGDQLGDLESILQAAEETRGGGIQQILMSMAAIQDALPDPTPAVIYRVLSAKMKFQPEWSPFVGAFREENYTLEPYTQVESLQGISHDITYTAEGNIAITDIEGRVMLLDQNSKVIADSSKTGVVLQEPCGITYYPKDDVLVVGDNMAGQLTMLDPRTLQFVKNVKLAGITNPIAVATLNDDETLVVTQALCTDDVKMGLFHVNGDCLKLWSTYDIDKQLSRPCHTFVDSKNRIWVPEICGDDFEVVSILGFDADGHLLHKLKTPKWPLGMAEYRGEILVALSDGGRPGYPDYPGEVLAWNVKDNTSRTILHWSQTDLSTVGRILSLAVYKDTLAVLGTCGLRLYNIRQFSPGPAGMKQLPGDNVMKKTDQENQHEHSELSERVSMVNGVCDPIEGGFEG